MRIGSPIRFLGVLGVLDVLGVLGVLCVPLAAHAEDLSYTRDIAPLLWTHCGSCHRPGGSAPFSLLDYEDVFPRAKQIAAATKARVMPPWLPDSRAREFSNDRRLDDESIRSIQDWVVQGAHEGSRADLPPRPSWDDGWQLGTPDLVVTLPKPYALQPGPDDVFRTFVMPIPLESERYVRGVEIRPDNRRVVHHASMAIDKTRGSRRQDDADPEPGFADGMISQGARSPEGRAIGWTPGITPAFERDGMAWRLDKGSDLVVQVHLLPPASGAAESVSLSVGFYFTDRAPARLPLDFKLGSKSIDIPAGTTDYTIEDSYVLPVDVEVLSVYPHAHYLATEMKADAILPDGTARSLISIRDWDFLWQDEYRFAVPVSLPAGTRLTMRYRYDNSGPNQRDRRRPPSRVTFGPQSSDEMGDLWLRLLPRSPDDAAVLARGYKEKELRQDIAAGERLVADQPRDANRHNALALSYMQAGRVADAKARLETAARLAPDHAGIQNNLGHVLQMQGDVQDAIERFQEAVRLAPGNDLVHLNLGNALQEAGEAEAAIPYFQRAIELNPAAADAHNNLGVALGSLGLLDEAVAHFKQALDIQPDYADARDNLAMVLELLKTQRKN